MRRRLLYLTVTLFAAASLAGCQQKDPEPGDIAGYDEGEEYLSIWVHSIEDTEEGQAYKESVETFNEAYDGQYFADIEFVPRNDSGGGYSDKVNASVMAGGLPDVLTVDGPNISAYAANGIIQPLADLTEEEESEYLPSIIEQGTVNDDLTLSASWNPAWVSTITKISSRKPALRSRMRMTRGHGPNFLTFSRNSSPLWMRKTATRST